MVLGAGHSGLLPRELSVKRELFCNFSEGKFVAQMFEHVQNVGDKLANLSDQSEEIRKNLFRRFEDFLVKTVHQLVANRCKV